MKLNNKGFALTSIIYMLIVLFLMIMLLVLSNLAQRKVVLDKIKHDVKISLNQGGQLAQNTYTVTFDPQGGQINQTTKQVTYGEPYGELPTPTKEGYMFLGWNGKNMFNKDKVIKSKELNADGTTTSNSPTWYTSDYIHVKPNTDYVVSSTKKTRGYANCFYDNDKQFVLYISKTLGKISSSDDSSFLRINGLLSELDNNIQIEEGSTETPYEPYYITSDTMVVQENNHTLKAIWAPAYTITFNPNGGTISQTTKEVAYNEPYGELPTPTREGYTFLGWNGKNLFNKEEAQIGYEISNYDITENSGWFTTNFIEIDSEKEYKISGKGAGSSILMYDENKEIIGKTFTGTEKVSNLLSNTKFIKLNGMLSNLETFQLEEGNTATEYETYYITSDTKVIQENNHTLKAIWQANQ